MLQQAVSKPGLASPAPRLNARANHLVQYEVAHEQLLKAMAEMAAVTQEVRLNCERLAAARLQIARASRARLELWDRVRAFLVQRAETATSELLRKLAAENSEVREAGSAMIAEWSSEAIEADWPRYCEAARQMRWKQMSIVRHERRDLLPVLQRLSGHPTEPEARRALARGLIVSDMHPGRG